MKVCADGFSFDFTDALEARNCSLLSSPQCRQMEYKFPQVACAIHECPNSG